MSGSPSSPTLLQRARACYLRLCPWCPPDLATEKSTTMLAYIEGSNTHLKMLNRERDIWHTLHLGLNGELSEYKKLIEEIYACEKDSDDWVMNAMLLIDQFVKHPKRLDKLLDARLKLMYGEVCSTETDAVTNLTNE